MKNIRPVYYIVLLGLIIRILFYFFGAEIYFGSKDFIIQGDTGDFFLPFKNLLEHGSFSVNLNHPDGVFGREPGYSFVIGLSYLLVGKDFFLAIKLVVFLQILFDSFIVLIFYKVTQNLFKNETTAFIAAILYATYPFAFLWTSVAYAEILGINCCILSIYFSSKSSNKSNLLSGIFAGIGTLIRPQLLLLAVAFIVSFFLLSILKKQYKWAVLVFYIVGFSTTYGLWPARNLFFHKELVLMKKVEGVTRAISSDQLSFAFFMWSVKTDWEPQISQILFKKPVELPEWVWKLSIEDSIKIRKALFLSDNCADGFRQLRRQQPLLKIEDCTEETAKLWKELRQSVIEKEPLKFYFLVPLSNLKKAFFKSGLIKSFNRPDKSTVTILLTNLLFNYRTILLLLGVLGVFLSLKNNLSLTNLYLSIYFVLLYFWLCFLYRDMDIRYLLPADVVLLLQGSYIIERALVLFRKK